MDELLEGVRQLAQELAFEHFAGPPVDPEVIAERLGIGVVRRRLPAHWAPSAENASIHVSEDMPPERQRFTIAHELLEILAVRASPPFLDLQELANRAEWLLQIGAAELLMPRQWFESAGAKCDWNLAHLRELFEVSWEAAARRVPACTLAICTIADNGRITTRMGSESLQFPHVPSPSEWQAIAGAYDAWPEKTPQHRSTEEFHCTAWPALPECNNIRRVCLLTYPRG